MRATSPLLLALLGVSACSATGGDNGFLGAGGAGAGSGTLNAGPGGGDPMLDAASAVGSTGTSSSGCSEAAKLVYIIGSDNAFFSFYPPTLEINHIGYIACPGAGIATPFSMAVDRQGVAWVLFSDGRIFHVDTITAACTATAFQPGQQGFTTFGMGFVSDTSGSDAETLFVGDYLGAGLGRIDTQSLALAFVGGYDQLPGQAAELTGTGDARLYGFFYGPPVIIAEIDKSNAHIVSQAPQPSIDIGSGWAFAFWGGDFYLFTSPTGDSQIDKYSPSMGTTSTVKTNLGSNIVGAGVSTCAPVEPPE